jgi:hypothetical protein
MTKGIGVFYTSSSLDRGLTTAYIHSIHVTKDVSCILIVPINAVNIISTTPIRGMIGLKLLHI